LSRSTFAALVLAGLAIRAVALPGPGTGDLTIWKVWSYNAARHGVGGMYGVGGAPPERRVLDYAGTQATVDYPPLALYELGVAGRAYRAWSHGRFPNETPLNAFVKLPGLIADIGIALLLFNAVRARVGEGTARLTALAYWLNPAALFDVSILGYLDAPYILPAIGAIVAAASGWPALAGALVAAAMLTKAQGVFILPAVAVALWRARDPAAVANRLLRAAAGGCVTTVAIVVPVVLAGGWPNLVQALGRLATHDML
jgi:Gpi18-like mannosyltransferase